MAEKIRILVIILLFFTMALSGDSSLVDFIEENGLQLYWDDIIQRGIIWRGTELVSFMPEFPLAAVNLQRFISIEPLYVRNGVLYIPETTAEIMSEALFPINVEGLRTVSTIFIDPGHGGKDPGTIGTLASKQQLYEKDIVLGVALDVAEHLRSRFPEKRIILSRQNDVYITLEERTEMANELVSSTDEKVLFISIHANAALNSRAKGIELWYLPPEYRRQVLQPNDIASGNSSVLPILNTILEEEYTVESIILAKNIEQGMLAELSEFTSSRGLKEMDWYVVRKAHMPSVLIEVGFVTNKEEIELLNDPSYLQRVSTGIYNGIISFVQDFESVSQ